MKIIFMGTPDFAVGTLRSLAEAGHEITHLPVFTSITVNASVGSIMR